MLLRTGMSARRPGGSAAIRSLRLPPKYGGWRVPHGGLNYQTVTRAQYSKSSHQPAIKLLQPMKRHLSLLVSLAMLSLANFGHATTLYWDGGTINIPTTGDGISQGGAGTWDTTIQNWDQGAGLAHIAWNNSQNYDAYFASPIGLVTLNAAITANSLTIASTNGYVITDGGNSANTLTLNVATNNASVTVGANVVNSTTFSTYGSGTLTLTNTCPGLTGTLAINAGTLGLGNHATGSTTANSFSDVTIGSVGTFYLDPGSSTTYNQNIAGQGAVSVHANSYTSVVYLAGDNSFSGNVYINQANLQVASISDTAPSGLGQGTNLVIGAGNSTTDFTYAGGGDTTMRTVTLGGTAGAMTILASGSGPLALLGPLAHGNVYKHTLGLNGSYTGLNIFGGTVTDNPNNPASTNTTVVSKGGAGVWMLAGTNTYSGGTTLGGGTLQITNDYALGAATGAVNFTSSSTLRSASDNVTLGASRTVTISSGVTATFAASDANNFYVAAFITGAGAVSKGSSAYNFGWVRFSNDTNNYTGDFSVGFGNTEFTSVADQGTPSSLGAGAAASGGRITLGNSTSTGTFRYIGTGNSATHRPLNWTATSASGSYNLDNTNTGTIAFLATTQMVNATGSKTLNLIGSNTGTNTLAQVINDNGGTTSLSKSGSGKWILSGTNTYSGVTTISGGNLSVSSDANLGTAPGSATAASLVISAGALSTSASFTLNANRGIALGPTTGSGSGTLDVAGGTTLAYGGIIANNGSGIGALSKTSGGTLTLSGVNTFSGDTLINAGTLALSGSGAIAGSPNIGIAAGAALDVSGVSGGYALGSSQTLYATNGATAAINGSLNLSSAALVMTNTPNTPTITVTGGALTLAGGTVVTVNVKNGGHGLSAGSYKLIAKGSGGSVVGPAPTAVTVGGDGLASGATAALSISSGELYLDVSGGTLTPPVVNSFGLGGGGVVLSFSGPNGQTWKILTSTNVAKQLIQWDTVTSGTFAGAVVNYTNASSTEPKRFYRVTSP